jgi:sugar phosphate isomerase/epimerase
MRLGCICGSFNRAFAAGQMDQLRFVAHCADVLRVAGVEFQDIHFPETRPAYLDRLRRAATDRGLAIIGIGIHNDFGRRDECLRASEVIKVKQWVEVAERLGAPMVRVFAGWPEGTPAERWADMIAALREAAAFAQAAGVRLALENEAGFTPSVSEHVRILEEVGSPALQLLLDTGNYRAGWPSVKEAATRAVHIHAKFWKVGPSGEEPTMDYPGLLAQLRQSRYLGWITFEYEAAEPEVSGLPRAFAYLRRLLESDPIARQ